MYEEEVKYVIIKQVKRSGFKKRITKPMKQTQTGSTRINLRRKAWDLFSKWIRERDGQRCITCGSRNQLCAGHFWHGVLDFDEMNVNCQCKQCNTHMSGNLAPYSIYLINKYGTEKFKDLEKRYYLAMRGEFRSDKDYIDLIEKINGSLPKTHPSLPKNFGKFK